MAPSGEANAEQRLADLERQVKDLKKKPKDFWDRLQSVSGIVSGLLVAIMGFYLTGSVNRALQERQLQFSSAKDMQELLNKLYDPKTTGDDKDAAAQVLALFGKYAIHPLIHTLQSNEANRSVAAVGGLQAIGFADPENTCRELVRVIENRTGVFVWFTHLSCIRLMRETACVNAIPALERYRKLLPTAEYKRAVRDEPPPTPESIEELQRATTDALESLRRAPAR